MYGPQIVLLKGMDGSRRKGRDGVERGIIHPLTDLKEVGCQVVSFVCGVCWSGENVKKINGKGLLTISEGRKCYLFNVIYTYLERL